MAEIQIDYLAVLVAVVANFVFGFVWYTPLFGKVWAQEMGMDPNAKPDGGTMAKGMILMVVGNFLMAYVLAHSILAWNPVTWGLPPADVSDVMYAMNAAFFTWLGFFLPVDLSTLAWEKKSFKLFAINTSYHFLSLVIVALILVYM